MSSDRRRRAVEELLGAKGKRVCGNVCDLSMVGLKPSAAVEPKIHSSAKDFN